MEKNAVKASKNTREIWKTDSQTGKLLDLHDKRL